MLKIMSELSDWVRRRFQRKLTLTADGWPVDADIHKPGTRICVPANGRVYYVGKGGEWRRNRKEELLLRAAVKKAA